MPRLVPPQGDTINGIFVPGGVSINHCTWGVQRRKDIYGDDPNCYRPERWLEADEESRRVMDGTLEFVFGGSGRWSCLGKTIALMEIYKVLVEVSLTSSLFSVSPNTLENSLIIANCKISTSFFDDLILPYIILLVLGSPSNLPFFFRQKCLYGSQGLICHRATYMLGFRGKNLVRWKVVMVKVRSSPF
jgi:hypothetical protein